MFAAELNGLVIIMNKEEQDLWVTSQKQDLKKLGIKQSWIALQLEIHESTLTNYFKGKGGLGEDKIKKLNETIERLVATR